MTKQTKANLIRQWIGGDLNFTTDDKVIFWQACQKYNSTQLGTGKMASGAIKKTTGLTGLVVAANPHHTLGALYSKILRAVQKMPPNAAYRKYTEQIVKERAEVLKSTKEVEQVEKKIGCGQVEELIVQAENELILARKMLAWKPWEPLITKPLPNQWTWPPTK